MAEEIKSEQFQSGAKGFSAPTISLPKGGGAIRGIGEKFAANPVAGMASMTVPIAVSPGRAGFAPQLSLSYSSGSGNGPFGFGWSLSIPAITRKTDKGLPQYRDVEESDVYILSGAEDLVPVLNTDGSRFEDDTTTIGYIIHRYRPRVEGLFARLERWTNKTTRDTHWRSISRDNITTIYGKTKQSRIADPADPLHIFTWLICESYDDKGNVIVYEYESENDHGVVLTQTNERNRQRTANRHLKRVKYGNRVSRLSDPDLSRMEWLFEVVFDYDEHHYKTLDHDPDRPETEQHRYVRASAASGVSGEPVWAVRPDPFSSHRAGFEVRTYRRCRRVLMFHRFDELGPDPCLVRSTEFEYDDLDYSKPTTIEAELAREGSTRFASFIRSVTQSGFVRDETKPVIERDGIKYFTYLKKSMPPLEFDYSKAIIQDDIKNLNADSLENLPMGLDGTEHQWVDLDGEGVSGILTQRSGAWLYKPNLGNGRFGPQQTIASIPSLASPGSRQQFLDLAGDGQLDLAQFSGLTPGFYERSRDEEWEPFRAFEQLPNIPWDEPNLRFIDLNGDGHADVLITEDEVFTWHPSLGEDGFGPARKVEWSSDEERGPKLVFANAEQSIYLADMCGDGLTDLIRIRNSEICYWPNIGYGHFGAKVTMDNAPWFDNPNEFDQRRVRVADIDGSGINDVIYLGRDGVRLYFNQSGNRWSDPRRLTQFPRVDNLASVMTADLLGNGTACLVWSSGLPADMRQPMRYIDLMGGQKPHLMIGSVNNLGAETRFEYSASTKFYLADKLAGKPWVTRIPFPVHVVERVETHDHISGNRFVTRYAYHHGYFDGVEREFQGFGMVEQWDTEEFAASDANQKVPSGANFEQSSHVSPVLTRTWFHTGVYLGREYVSNFFAGLRNDKDLGEYYREPGLTDAQATTLLLEDTVLPVGLTVEEEREACRALKGSTLRQEVYALDGTAKEKHPYTVTEQNFTISRLQPKAGNQHAVFFAHAREAISYHYERDPADPRVTHALTLRTDDYGNVLRSVEIGYRRRDLPGVEAEQKETHVTFTVNRFVNQADETDWYRIGLPVETRSYEIVKASEATITDGRVNPFRFEEIEKLTSGLFPPKQVEPNAVRQWPYEKWDWRTNPANAPAEARLRPIEHTRTLYRADSLTGPLPLGHIQSLALPFESYKLAFTAELLAAIFGGKLTDAMLADDGRYVHSEGDANWWIPSGRVFYSPDTDPARELAHAKENFFLPHRYRDPFHTDAIGTDTFVSYDVYRLLVQETRDALDNRVTVGQRDIDPTKPLVRNGQDYRVLQPALVMDPNRNQSSVAFDALGMVAGTAVMGKPEDKPVPGDKLSVTFNADLTQSQIDQFFANPNGAIAATLLDDSTTRIIYDLTRYSREPDPKKKTPPFAATLARETHASEAVPPGGLKIQVSFSYSDGFGREIQKKIQAEPGPVPKRDPITGRAITVDGQPVMTTDDVSPRWVGSGWTVFNNKGKPVRRFEPFFTDRHGFEFDVRIGVSPVRFYDPVGRVVGTLHPNHTWEKVVFDPWKQETWDVNDTIIRTDPKLANPKKDPDVGDNFRRLSESEYIPTWHDLRTNPANAVEAAKKWPDARDRDAEESAARKAALHAETPTVVRFDSLGRTFLTIAHNRFKRGDTPTTDPPTEEFYRTRVTFDIEGNQREVIDARDHIVMRYDYDMLSNRAHQQSMDAGERWMLNDLAGKPLYSWDSRDHRFRTVYDQLRRPVESRLLVEGAASELLVGRTVYGEAKADPEANNLRGKTVEAFDQAGTVTTDQYDFKGNLLRTRRQLAQEYKETLNWKTPVPLEPAIYATSTRYDALNRPTQMTLPDRSVIHLIYNEANLPEQVGARLRGAASVTQFIRDIDYDARGQRTLIDFGNEVRTTYAYDRDTFRLLRLLTRRDPGAFPDDCPTPPPVDWPGCQVQDLHYSYDPAGNITSVRDDAQQRIYFRNTRVEPSAEYTYDAIYRLIEATGREHLGSTTHPTPPDAFNGFHTGLDHPNGDAMGNYVERYVYDAVGNIMSMRHRGSGPAPGWRRCYQYAADSNRLLSTSNPADPHKPDDPYAKDYSDTPFYAEKYEYDAHGNMTRMPHLPLMQWDYSDQLQATSKQVVTTGGTPVTTWYVYDAGGQRVRKVTESEAIAPATPTRRTERIYLGTFEIYREYSGGGTTVNLEREALHIMDDRQRVALVETRTDTASPQQLIRYQFGNHLGSASLELDDKAQIISYEEYYPYGSTSYQAARNKTETPKRYRYTGKERDEESGLYYHKARYYASWLTRWTSADPIGIKDGPNVYTYAHQNPLAAIDHDGKNAILTVDEKKHTITYSTTVHLYADAKDKDKAERVATNAEQFFQNKIGSYTGDHGQKWSVRFNVKYSVHTDHAMPVKLKTETGAVKTDTVEVTDQKNYEADKIKPGDNFLQLEEKHPQGWGGYINPEVGPTKEQSHRYVGASTGFLYKSGDAIVKKNGIDVTQQVDFTEREMRNNLIHETGHLLGFDERYKGNNRSTHPGFESDFMGNSVSGEKWIVNTHFEDAAKFALGVSLGQSSHLLFRGRLDQTSSGEMLASDPQYGLIQEQHRKREVEYFKHFRLLRPW